MFSQTDASLSRDRNLNFNLSETNYVQRLDNQKKKETAGNVRAVKFSSLSSAVQTKEKEARSKEYDNYINTFTSSSNKNNPRQQPGGFRQAKQAGGGGGGPVAAMKKTSSVESPGRKLLRTPTQEMKRLNTQEFSFFLFSPPGNYKLKLILVKTPIQQFYYA